MNIRVNVDQIKDSGLQLDRELTQADLASILETEPPTGFRAAGPAHLAVRLERVNEGDIVARGGFTAPAAAECRRCLDSVRLEVPVAFALDFVNQSSLPEIEGSEDDEDAGEGDVAGTLVGGASDQIVYTGKELDFGSVVREQLLLALPMDALCRDDCKGLCQICGRNLNTDPCQCDRQIPDPRWAALKQIKLT